MNKLIARLLLGAALAIVIVPLVLAATHSLTYTAQQDTAVQTRLIPAVNRAKCQAYGRPDNCVTADLTGRCIVRSVCQAANLKTGSAACTAWSTEFVESCVIFTQNAAGEAAYLKEKANKGMVDDFLSTYTLETKDYCVAWDLMSPSAQSTHCTTAPPAGLGLPSNCRPCPEVN